MSRTFSILLLKPGERFDHGGEAWVVINWHAGPHEPAESAALVRAYRRSDGVIEPFSLATRVTPRTLSQARELARRQREADLLRVDLSLWRHKHP